MKVSEITLDILKQYLRVAGTADDILLKAILAGAIQFSVNYTGLSETDLDDKPDSHLLFLPFVPICMKFARLLLPDYKLIQPLLKSLDLIARIFYKR